MFRNRLVAFFMIVGLVTYGAGCGSNGSQGGGGGSFNNSNIDLAVGDGLLAQVALYFDILAFSPSGTTLFPAPDVVLDSAGSGVGAPISLVFAGADKEDLVICDGSFFGGSFSGNDTVSIFRDYKTLVDGELPDTTFTNGGALGIDDPIQCAYDSAEDVLAVSNSAGDEVILIYDFTAIAAGTDPVVTAVTLNNAASLIDEPIGIAVTGDDLWVANSGNSTAGEPCVTGYRDIATLANADAPDVELDADVSFFNSTSGGFACFYVQVGDNPFDSTDEDTLYVSTIDGSLYGFADAENLTTNALPDFVLLPGPGKLEVPGQPAIAGDRLYVPNLGFGVIAPICSEAPAVVGFSSIGSLTNGQVPTVTLEKDATTLANGNDLTVVGGALFAAGSSQCGFSIPFSGNVAIYRDASSISTDQAPDILIPGSTSLVTDIGFPISVEATVIDQGT